MIFEKRTSSLNIDFHESGYTIISNFVRTVSGSFSICSLRPHFDDLIVVSHRNKSVTRLFFFFFLLECMHWALLFFRRKYSDKSIIFCGQLWFVSSHGCRIFCSLCRLCHLKMIVTWIQNQTKKPIYTCWFQSDNKISANGYRRLVLSVLLVAFEVNSFWLRFSWNKCIVCGSRESIF